MNIETTTRFIASTTHFKPFPYYDLEVVQWALLFGISFLLGIGIGANDVADAFGTSVGTGTVTVIQAFILATIVEMMGAVGSGVFGATGTSLRIIDTSVFEDDPDELVIGQIAMIVGCAVWLMIATYYAMPVSSIHSILGATMGFCLVLRGFRGIMWDRVLVVAGVWILSPLISAIFTLLVFFIIDITILQRKHPLETGLFYLPFIYFLVVFINVLLLLQDGSRVLHFQNIPVLNTVAYALMAGVLAGFGALYIVGPIMERRIKKKDHELPRIASRLSYSFPVSPRNWVVRIFNWAFPEHRKDDQKVVRLFSFLQVMTACFAGLAHGANDVVNAVWPIMDLVKMYNDEYQTNNTKLNISVYVILLSTLAVLIGIWTLGINVMRTVGEDIIKMNPATGFSVEFGAGLVCIATNVFSVPQSLTHCLVASIFALGLVRSGPLLQWKTVRYVVLSWFLTIPMSALIAAATMYFLKLVLNSTNYISIG